MLSGTMSSNRHLWATASVHCESECVDADLQSPAGPGAVRRAKSVPRQRIVQLGSVVSPKLHSSLATPAKTCQQALCSSPTCSKIGEQVLSRPHDVGPALRGAHVVPPVGEMSSYRVAVPTGGGGAVCSGSGGAGSTTRFAQPQPAFAAWSWISL